MFTTVQPPYWSDKPCIVIAGGPSLRKYDIRDLRSKGRVILLNDAIRYCKGDALFSMDSNWIRRSASLAAEFEGEGIWIATTEYIKPYVGEFKSQIHYLRKSSEFGLNADLGKINTRGNSGYGVLGLLFHKRAKLVYLLGYDMKVGPHEQWHSAEKELELPKRASIQYYYRGWPKEFELASTQLEEAGVKVVNLNPDSAVTCFDYGTYEGFGLKPSK